jgi:Na+-exporting ATPase
MLILNSVLTITMVVGMTVMRKANVVVRDLSALEALGGVTNICSDKTGTLTQDAMIVKKVWLPKVGIYTVNHSTNPDDPTEGAVTKRPITAPHPPRNQDNPDYDQQRSAAALKFDIPSEYAAKDQRMRKQNSEEEEAAEVTPELKAFLRPTALCNLATVKHEKIEGEVGRKWQTTGEPTEIALQVFAHRFDFGRRRLESEGWKQVAEFPFDSSIKRMSVIYNSPDNEISLVFTKGAVERILDFCSSIGTGSNNQPITEELKEQVIAQMDEFAAQGQRVLAVASRTWEGDFVSKGRKSGDDELRKEVEQDLTLVGLVGIYDPPRDETKDVIRECSEAGIKVHMLTVSKTPRNYTKQLLIYGTGRPPSHSNRHCKGNWNHPSQSWNPTSRCLGINR